MPFARRTIEIGSLLLDTNNYRNLPQSSQASAHSAMIGEQGRKLVVLAKDIIEHGLNPFDLTMVVDAADGSGNFIVVEGNRRHCAINLVLHPELAERTALYSAFSKLNKESVGKVPTSIECVVAPNRKDGALWIRRKHASDLGGAGTDSWGAMAKARADAKDGVDRPDLAAVNFVAAQAGLNADVQKVLAGSRFNITTLDRLLRAKDVQAAVGFKIQDEKLVSDCDRARISEVFTEIVSVIAKGEHKGKEFTERDVDTEDKRRGFLEKILKGKPKKASAPGWEISGNPKGIKIKSGSSKTKTKPTTRERKKLLPSDFKLEISNVKINDIFGELKRLNVEDNPHAVSVLFRVFLQFTIDSYITKHSISVKRNAKGWVEDTMAVQLSKVEKHLEQRKVMTHGELKPIRTACSNANSLIAPETLNAYVHSRWMQPNPFDLKTSWNMVQEFMGRIWADLK